MNLSKIKFLCLLAALAAFTFTSCKKSKLNKQTTTSADNAIAESSFDDMFNQADAGAAETQKTSGIQADTCRVATFVKTTNGRTVTVDFGTGCEGLDGRTRSGKIIVDIVGTYREAGSKWTITTDNYVVDGYAVEGAKIVENKGANASGNTEFHISVNGTVTTPDGEEITWESTRVREWIEGEDTGFFTPDSTKASGYMGLDGIVDDVYSITGSASGTNREGRPFTVAATKALRLQFCGLVMEITEGTLEIAPDDLDPRTVDYGNATCDNKATVTIGNNTKEINLR